MKKLTSALLASALLVSSFAGLGVAVQADTSSVSEPQIVYADFEDWTSSRNLRACAGLGLSATMTNSMISLETEDAAIGSQCISVLTPGNNDATWGFFRYGADYINDKYVFTTIQNKLVSDSSYAETCDAAITFYAKLADGGVDEEGNEIDTITFNAGLISNANGSQVAYQTEVTVTEEWAKYTVPLSSLSDSTVGDLFTQMIANGTCSAGSASAFNHFRFSFGGETATVYFDQLALSGSDLYAGCSISFQYAGTSGDATTFKTTITDAADEVLNGGSTTVTTDLPQIVYATFEEWTSSRNLRACAGLGLSTTMTNSMISLETEGAAVGSQYISVLTPGNNDATWGFFRYGADYINDKYVFTDIQNKLVADSSYADTCDACITFYAKLADGGVDEEGNEIDTITFNAGLISNANGSQVAYQAEVTVTEEWAKYSIPLSSLSDSTVGDLFTQMAANGTCSAGSASAFNHFRFSFGGETATVYFDQLALAGTDLVAGATISFQYAGTSGDATTFKTEITTTEDTGSTSSSTSSDTSSEDTSSEDTTSKEEGGDPVGATDADGIYPLDAFTNYSVTSTAQSSSLTMPRADGLLLKTTAAQDSVITIKLASGSDNLTLTIPVSAGTDMVSMDFANMSSGNAAFSRLKKNNLTITISSDNDVTINSMSYYIYSYLLDRSTLDVDGGDVLMGDTNQDGEVTTVDALLALQHAVGTVTLTGDAFTAGDMDYSNDITTLDALLILQLALGAS